MFGKTKKIKELEKENLRFEFLLEKAHANVDAMSREIERLTKQNDKLMDRFMATDFQTLQTFTLPERSELIPDYDQTLDEENAGEILSG